MTGKVFARIAFFSRRGRRALASARCRLPLPVHLPLPVRVLVCLGLVMTASALMGTSRGQALTIREVQFSTAEAGWNSPHDGEVIALTGGVVTHIAGFRITLQDPSLGNEWAGIELRAYENEAPLQALRVGDRVDFENLHLEEFRGGTIPQFKNDSRFVVVSSNNPLPEPVLVPLSDLAYPPDRERCEKYEGMLIAVENVRVGEMDWGKAEDNYELTDGTHSMWASDYYNLDIALPPFPTYFVQRGERYARIVGVFQEYFHPEEGWDYYQLLPRGAGDYEPSSLYTIRDVQQSTAEDEWASPMIGVRIDLQAVVSMARDRSGLLALIDPWLGAEWAGILLMDEGDRLGSSTIGDEVRLTGVLVTEQEGMTALSFDEQSAIEVTARGVAVPGIAAPAAHLSRHAGPDLAERYEGMLVTITNGTVVRRGVPEGSALYYVAVGTDTLLASDVESSVLPPDSTFFVRAGDRLGRLRGVVLQTEATEGARYILRPRLASDYLFVTGDEILTSWGRLKHEFR
ncbi:MAG: hypothetical protein KBD56_05425 [Candidatus Eisenbacteria bacterium]|nr:hypothetical protein [Candidatus Eisenbacteria bacterium]